MDQRHRRSPSSERLLGISSFSPPASSAAMTTGFELNEDDIFWTSDLPEPNRYHQATTATIHNNNRHRNHRTEFHHNSGILAALPDSDDDRKVLYRKPVVASSSSSRTIPSLPRRQQERELPLRSQSRKFQHSAPVNVPVLSAAMAKKRSSRYADVAIDDTEDEEEMLPPHELVARGSGVSPNTTFSVLEGVGRTLKGRDLRQVRNAVWRKTGFLD